MAAAAADSKCRIVLDASLTPDTAEPIDAIIKVTVSDTKSEFKTMKSNGGLHGFVLAVHTAFADHLTLHLSPDDIWSVITQGVGTHVERNAEKLRAKFVNHDGKKTIVVRRDGFVRGKTTLKDWMGVVTELTAGLRTFDNGKSTLMKTMVQRFSTTEAIHTFGYEAALLSAMQHYASYIVRTKCGIPAIEFTGTKSDWMSLLDAVQALDLDGLDETLRPWNKRLIEVVGKLVDCRLKGKTKANVTFLKSIYKYENAKGSGCAHVSGWISHLFPYMGRKDETDMSRLTAHLEEKKPSVTTNMFPSGLLTTPFTWEYCGLSYPMQILSGFDGPRVDEDGVRCDHGFNVQYVGDATEVGVEVESDVVVPAAAARMEIDAPVAPAAATTATMEEEETTAASAKETEETEETKLKKRLSQCIPSSTGSVYVGKVTRNRK